MLLVGLRPACSVPSQPGGLPTSVPAEPLLPLPRICSPHILCFLSPCSPPDHPPGHPLSSTPMIQIPAATVKLCAWTTKAWRGS